MANKKRKTQSKDKIKAPDNEFNQPQLIQAPLAPKTWWIHNELTRKGNNLWWILLLSCLRITAETNMEQSPSHNWSSPMQEFNFLLTVLCIKTSGWSTWSLGAYPTFPNLAEWYILKTRPSSTSSEQSHHNPTGAAAVGMNSHQDIKFRVLFGTMFRIHPLILSNEYKFQTGVLMVQSEKNPVTLILLITLINDCYSFSVVTGTKHNCMIKEEGYKEITAIPCFSSCNTEQRKCNWKNTLNQGIQLQYLMALTEIKTLKKLKLFLWLWQLQVIVIEHQKRSDM